jgi:Immunity protein 7
MFEWHGWATIRKTAAVEYFDEMDETTLSRIRALLTESDRQSNETADLRAANGDWHVWLAGRHNHLDPAVVPLFRAIAEVARGSYGILYLYDDEASEGWDRWVMRRGEIARVEDHDLSPHIGVVEDAEDLG